MACMRKRTISKGLEQLMTTPEQRASAHLSTVVI